MLNTYVKTLILQDNWMTTEAADFVGEMLGENNTIQYVSLKQCNLRHEGKTSTNDFVND